MVYTSIKFLLDWRLVMTDSKLPPQLLLQKTKNQRLILRPKNQLSMCRLMSIQRLKTFFSWVKSIPKISINFLKFIGNGIIYYWPIKSYERNVVLAFLFTFILMKLLTFSIVGV